MQEKETFCRTGKANMLYSPAAIGNVLEMLGWKNNTVHKLHSPGKCVTNDHTGLDLNTAAL